MAETLKVPGLKRQYRRRGRHRRNGVQAAAAKALTAGKLHLGRPIPRLPRALAAIATGSNHVMVDAAIVLLQAEDKALIDRVLKGDIRIQEAANQVRDRAVVIAGLRRLSSEDKAVVGRTVGAETLFDEVVVPAL
jgi:hypothetical protein